MSDSVNHPKHYNMYKGIEVIDLVEQMNFSRGNAVKYIARAGLKDPSKEIEDLEKARWYLDREIQRIKKLCDEDVAKELHQSDLIPTAETNVEKEVPIPNVAKISSIISAVQSTAATVDNISTCMAQISVILATLGIPPAPAREIGATILAAEHKFRMARKNDVPKIY